MIVGRPPCALVPRHRPEPRGARARLAAVPALVGLVSVFGCGRAPDAPVRTPAATGHGCLGHAEPRPGGGWYPVHGGELSSGSEGPGTSRQDSTPALDRLTGLARAALPAGFAPTHALEIQHGQCVWSRGVELVDPSSGRVALFWEQLRAPRSRDEPHVGPIDWEERADGGAIRTDAAFPDYQAVRVVLGDGRVLGITALGARAHSTAGWPTTQALRPGPLDAAPLTADQLRPLADRLVRADQR